MDTRKLMNRIALGAWSAFGLLALIALWVPSLADLLWSGGGLLLAQTGTVVGDVRESDTTDDHRVPSVTDALTLIEPSRFPFTTFLQRLGRADDMGQVVHKWGEYSRLPRSDTENGGGTTNGTNTITVSNVSYWRVNDLWIAPGNTAEPDNVYLVTARDTGANTVTLQKLPTTAQTSGSAYSAQSFGTMPALDSGVTLYWLSNALTEADDASASRGMQPAYEHNFAQTFDARVDISDHKMRSENYGEEDWQRMRRDNLFEMRKGMEYAFLLSTLIPTVTTDPNNSELRWTMGSMRHYIDDTISFTSATPTEADIVDLVYACFDDNNGSQQKVLFGGKTLTKRVDKVNADTNTLNVTRQERFAGVQVTRLVGRIGTLNVVYHPGLDEIGSPEDGIVADMNFVMRRDYQALERRPIEHKGQGRDKEGEYWITKRTLEVRNGDAHKYISGS